MAGEVVNAWNEQVLVASESTLGTTPNPAAAQAIETISCSMGPPQLGNTRDKQDRNPGRGMRTAFVEGRVDPMPFSFMTSVKSRAAVDTVPIEKAIYAAAGLGETINGATSVVYAPSANPVETSAFSGLSLYRLLGAATARYQAEQGRGGIVKRLTFAGGDKELTLSADGAFLGKYHLGYSASITLADGVGTSLVFASAEEGYRFGEVGWYLVESEVIKITAMNYSTFTATIARAQLGTSGAAHAAKPLYPYFPSPSYTGSPISEATSTVTIDSQAVRCIGFTIEITTGGDHLAGETGSRFRQGVKFVRYDCTIKCRLIGKREDLALIGKTTQRKSVAASVVQSTGSAGGIFTFALPQCEMELGEWPDPGNDVATLDLTLKGKDSATGNDMFSMTLT